MTRGSVFFFGFFFPFTFTASCENFEREAITMEPSFNIIVDLDLFRPKKPLSIHSGSVIKESGR